MINYQDKLTNFDNDINVYDEVVIGSPVWNGRLSSPINSVLNFLNLNNKKIWFILYSGSGKATKLTNSIHKKYVAAVITVLREPKNNPEELHKIVR